MLTIQQLKEKYNHEQAVLVLLARLHFNTCTTTEVTDFIAENKINWALLLQITKAHGLRSFVYYVIKQYKISVAPAFEERLKKSHDITRRKNLRMAVTLSKLVGDFKEKGITLIPYKGVVFAHRYYPDIALRESADIDFLVAAKNINEIENYFIANNYTAKTTVSKAFKKYYQLFFKDMVYSTPGTTETFSIEIHWRLMEQFSGNYPNYDFFIPHLEPYVLGGLPVNKLSPTYDFLALVSNHFVKDMGIKFKYLVDVAALIRKENNNIDNKIIFETATHYGFTKRLETGLSLTESLLGVSLANLVPYNNAADAYLPVPLAFPLHLPRLYINEPEFIKRSLQLQDNNLRRVKFILKSIQYMFLPTYADINQLKLPVYFLPLMIIIRPFRLLYLAINPKSSKTTL
ncbi:MAG: hypothetical protein JWQ79_2818 [Mucilaginibacter sp.]|nr:hypothetical protein [Mucilaginibacter sp.]